MGVDLHFIGSGISSGDSHNGFGKIVSFPVGGFPAAGTYAGTLYGVEYPVAEGGASVVHPINYQNVATQTCDVDEVHNGSGGVYTDWTTATNINYIPAATLFYTSTTVDASQTPVEVPTGSGDYYDSEFSYTYYYHNGSGAYVAESLTWQYWANGTFIVNYSQYPVVEGYQIEVPSGSGNYFENGKYNTYNWNGSGGVTTLTNQGSFYSAGTQITIIGIDIPVPEGSANLYYTGKGVRYNWDGSGGYVNAGEVGSCFANGTFITSDDNGSYYWDGDGNYYTE